MVTVEEKIYNKMPSDIQELFKKLPNPGSDEVVSLFPNNVKGEIGRAGRKSAGNYDATNFKMGVVTETGVKDSGSASRFFYCAKASKSERNRGCEELEDKEWDFNTMGTQTDEAIRARGRNPENQNKPMKNNHPTVKPQALMKYLIKLITPPGGTVLDPFAGSGSTLVAAKDLGHNYIGIEMTEEYIPIIKARLTQNN